MLWRCVAYNPHSAGEKSREEELARAFANYHVSGLSGTKCKNTLQILFAVLIELGRFEPMSGDIQVGSQHAAGVSIYLRDIVFTEYNVREICSIPAEYQGHVGALRCKRGDVDFCFLVVYAWVQGRTEAERLRVSRLWRYVASLCLRCPIAV